jgi:hypothetical protein
VITTIVTFPSEKIVAVIIITVVQPPSGGEGDDGRVKA